MTSDLRTIARETGKPAWSLTFQGECTRQLIAAGVPSRGEDGAMLGPDDLEELGEYFRAGKTPDAFCTMILGRLDDEYFRRDLPDEDR